MISCHSSGLFAANDFAGSVAVGSCHSDLRHDLRLDMRHDLRQLGGCKELPQRPARTLDTKTLDTKTLDTQTLDAQIWTPNLWTP